MKPYEDDLKEISEHNRDFRRVLFTGEHSQLVVMALQPEEEIGEEVHTVDQILYAVDGKGEAIVEGKTRSFGKGDVVVVPAGLRHNIRNRGDKAFKLFTVYAPAQHAPGTVHHSRADALAAETAETAAAGALPR